MRSTHHDKTFNPYDSRSKSLSRLNTPKEYAWGEARIREKCQYEVKILTGIRREMLLQQSGFGHRMKTKINNITLEGRSRLISSKNQLKLQCMRDGSSEYLRNRLYHVFDQKDPIPKMLETNEVREFLEKSESPIDKQIQSKIKNRINSLKKFSNLEITTNSPAKSTTSQNFFTYRRSSDGLPENLKVKLDLSSKPIWNEDKTPNKEIKKPILPKMNVPSTYRKKDHALQYLYKFIHKPRKIDNDIANIKKQIDRLRVRFPRDLSVKNKRIVKEERQRAEEVIKCEAKFLHKDELDIEKYISKKKAKLDKMDTSKEHELFSKSGGKLEKSIAVILSAKLKENENDMIFPHSSERSSRGESPQIRGFVHKPLNFSAFKPAILPLSQTSRSNLKNDINLENEKSDNKSNFGGWDVVNDKYKRDKSVPVYRRIDNSENMNNIDINKSPLGSCSPISSQHSNIEDEEIDEAPTWINDYYRTAFEFRKNKNAKKTIYTLANANPKKYIRNKKKNLVGFLNKITEESQIDTNTALQSAQNLAKNWRIALNDIQKQIGHTEKLNDALF